MIRKFLKDIEVERYKIAKNKLYIRGYFKLSSLTLQECMALERRSRLNNRHGVDLFGLFMDLSFDEKDKP